LNDSGDEFGVELEDIACILIRAMGE
jgi:hypothetical protein